MAYIKLNQFKLKSGCQLMSKRIFKASMLAGFVCLAATAQAAGEPAEQEKIGYKTVAEALKDLSQKPGISISNTDDGWTVANDAANKTLWTFSPATHPAYPAVVKRRVVDADGQVELRMAVLCQAEKAPCDQLVADYNALNQMALNQPAPAQQSVRVLADFDKTAQAQVVLERSRQYWQQLNSQQYQQVYSQFSDGLKKDISFNQWVYSQKQLAQKIGTLQSEAEYKVTWYENPPQLAAGWYAAVDYLMPYAQAQLCGFMVWRHQDDNSYVLQRIETNFIENTTAKHMSPQELYTLKQQMGCRL